MVAVDVAEIADALDEGFPQATAEKVYRLLGVLRELESTLQTAGKFTLKGGTALNVFHLPEIPRLSVDIDLMATGFPRAAAGSEERERAVRLVVDAVKRLGYGVQVDDSDAAGCTLHCNYRNTLDAPDGIKVDLDLLNRQTLISPKWKKGPTLFLADDLTYPVVDEAELLGQKLVAVAYRAHPRDLYDMHRMLGLAWHRKPRARAMYLAYSFLKDHEWHRLDYPVRLQVPYAPERLRDVLRTAESGPTLEALREQARQALAEGSPGFTAATPGELTLRDELVGGRKDAFADIAAEGDAERRRALTAHPGLGWRLEQAHRRNTSGS